MTDVVFITAKKKANQGFEADVKGFTDCTTSISHMFTNDISELPIENGESVTDHIQKKNNKFTVEGRYDGYSIVQYQDDSIGYEDRLNKAYNFLLGLRDNRTVFTLVTNLDVYENCAVASLTFNTTPETSGTLSFSMEVTQIRSARVERVTIVQVANVLSSKKLDAATNIPAGKKKTDTSVIVDLAEATTELGNTLAGGEALERETKAALSQGAQTQGG